MKKNVTCMLMTAVVLTLGAAAAYSQSTITATIPFGFRTIAGSQPAGTYQISRLPRMGDLYLIRNVATGAFTQTMISPTLGSSKDRKVKLVFRCGNESGCALSEVWGPDGLGARVQTPKLKPSEVERLAVVYVGQSANASDR
jgi:hypothetical protein